MGAPPPFRNPKYATDGALFNLKTDYK